MVGASAVGDHRAVRTTRVLALVAALVASLFIVAPAQAAAPPSAGRFIVVLEDGADSRATAAEYHRRDDVEVDLVYRRVLNGFAGEFSEGALGDLRADGRVDHITRDGSVQATATRTGATWGLDRIDQRLLPLSTTYTDAGAGQDVDVYVIDTGIRASHTEFGGRVVDGISFVSGSSSWADCNGHGTHVAGTIGGKTYGVASAVTLYAVRVLDCGGSGTWSGVIGGMDWVAGRPGTKKVANMSLGGGYSSDVNNAAAALVASGTTVAVAAGNDNRDACNASPASAAGVVTVGATTSSDARASYSNYGSCVELYAPGSSIKSAWSTGDTVTNTISGTSMASPHVAGVAALLAAGGESNIPLALRTAATSGIVSGASGTSNRLLFNGSHDPTVRITRSCSGGNCTFTATGWDADNEAVTFTWSGEPVTKGVVNGPTLGTTTQTATKSVNASTTYTVRVKGTAGGVASAEVSLTTTCVKKGNRVTCS